MLSHKNNLRRLAAFLLPALAVVGFCGCTMKGDVGGQGATVEVFAAVPLKKQIVEWDEYVGRLEAVEFVEVRARVSGYLDAIHFDEGQMVKKGDLLCIIDPKPFNAEVSHAKADLEQARATIKESAALLAQAGGRNRFDAAVEACRLRLRPILMTSFAFILGVLPLARAEGPGAELRQVLGTAVFVGMLGVTIFGLFLTPSFYVLLRALSWKQRTAARISSNVSIGETSGG